MGQYLPYNGFKLFNRKESGRFDVDLISENNKHEYVFEVDLQCLWIIRVA